MKYAFIAFACLVILGNAGLFLAFGDIERPKAEPKSTLAERINQICGQDQVTDWAIYEQDLVVTCAHKNSPYRTYAKVLPR